MKDIDLKCNYEDLSCLEQEAILNYNKAVKEFLDNWYLSLWFFDEMPWFMHNKGNRIPWYKFIYTQWEDEDKWRMQVFKKINNS